MAGRSDERRGFRAAAAARRTAGWLAAVLSLSTLPGSARGFSAPRSRGPFPSASLSTAATTRDLLSFAARIDGDAAEREEGDVAIASPLRFLGPYPTMPLRFPNLATSSQRERNVTGVSLDWVLDTAANVNTINAQVAQELELEKVGEAPGGVGASGALAGGDTFLLGDCELDVGSSAEAADATDATDATSEEREENNNFVFMQGLTASALPVASPAAAGLLGLAFFYCFEGGVEFDWGLDGEPSVTFHGSDRSLKVDGMTRVPFESLPVSMLPSVNVSINGVEIPALFDTGSPVTVLNERAAEAAGIALSFREKEQQGGGNFFSKIASNIETAKEAAQATARGDVLALAGGDGRPIRLVRSKSPHDVSVRLEPGDRTNESEYATIGTSRIFVGDLPGLAALGGLGGDAPPAAVLGMDVLRTRPKLVFRARQREIYF